MKQFLFFIILAAICTTVSSAQFRANSEPSVSQSLVRPSGSINSFLGLLNPENFLMRHNVSLNYMSFGGTSLSLASYTNSMMYKINSDLNLRADITLQGSPFGNGGSFSQSNLNKVFLSRAELNYRPSENFFLQLQYRELPMNYWGSYPYSPYSRFFGDE